MRRVLLGIVLMAALAAPAAAADSWSDPFPGVRRLHRVTGSQNVNALVVDLCAPGVSLRATASGERGRRTSSFGALVGAQAAVNGDFYSSGYRTDGLAMSGGAQWADTGDHGYVGPLAFGDRRAEIIHHAVEAGPEPWMREIVSGHPTILDDGAFVPSGDPLCTNRHPRTAAGLSADHTKLILVVVDGRASGRIGMTCDELAAVLAELGAWDGMNLDGGGSSTMWLAGPGVVNYPSDGSERIVGNHLGVYAGGSGPAASCPNRAPQGWLDGASCDAITGWAQDVDAPDAGIDVHLYVGGPAGDPAAVGIPVRAARRRDDLCGAIGSCDHGFRLLTPRSFLDGVARPVYAYGIDSEGGANAQLAGAPLMLQCAPPAPGPVEPGVGVRRHVPDGATFDAWRFLWPDVLVVPDEALAAYAAGPPLGPAPALVRADGEPAVYVLDGAATTLRHVPSPDAMDAWRFDWAAIAVDPAIPSYLPGATLLDRPYLVRGSGPEVYVIDEPPPLWAELVDDDVPPALSPGAEQLVTVVFRNRGSMTWAAGAVLLDGVPVSADVPPGDRGTFQVTLRAPAAPAAEVTQCFQLTTSGGHGFPDPPCVTYAVDPSADPTMLEGGCSAGGRPSGVAAILAAIFVIFLDTWRKRC